MAAIPAPDNRRDRTRLWRLRKRARPSSAAPASGPVGAAAYRRLFDGLDRSNLAPDDQMPASRSLFLAVPDPDPAGRDVNPQLSARAVAQDAARPVLGRDALR